jgi:two-component system, cell cycle sensor histidine kinase and response regulator CckA
MRFGIPDRASRAASGRPLPPLLRAGLIALLFLLFAALSRLLVVEPLGIAPIWPPGGLLLAALLLIERRAWAETLAAVFFANAVANLATGSPPLTAAGFALANCAEAGLGASLLRRYLGQPISLSRLREVVWYTALAGVGVNGLTAALGAGVAAITLGAPFAETWLTWWIAHGLGILLVGSFILTWAASPPGSGDWRPRRQLEFAMLCAGAIASALFIFGSPPAALRYPYLVFPFLLWAAARFGPRETATVSLGVAAIALWNTINGVGLFAVAGQPAAWQVLAAQAFLAVVLLSALVLAAVTEERRTASEELRRARLSLQEANMALQRRVVARTVERDEAAWQLAGEMDQRKRARALLEDSQAQLAAIIGSAMDAIITIDEEYHITMWNAAAEQMFRCPAPEALSLPLDRFIPARFHEAHREHIAAFRRTGVTTRAMGELRPLSGVRLDGEEFPIEASISQVSAGGRRLYTVIIRDITERVRAEAALRASEERFSKAFQLSSVAMVITSVPEGRVLDANDSYVRMFGRTRDQLLARHSSELDIWVNPAERDVIMETLRRDGRVREYETRLRAADSAERNVLFSADLLEISGETCALTSLYDITERRRLESQLVHAQKLESVGQLAGGIAHDFNNLLTAITGYADLVLAELPEGSPTHDDVYEILRAAERAAILTRQLLAFARRQPVDLAPIDLNGLIAELEKLLRRLISADIELSLRLAPALPAVKADSGQIEQVLLNLVVNARDAMPDGGRMIIETAAVTLDAAYAQGHLEVQPGGYVMLAVSDTGTGMSPEVRERVFEPFFTTKEPGKGTGLGLATCYGIVRQHGGTIWIYSEPGEGTSVKVYLPRAAEDGPLEAASGRETRLPLGDETVLVVEDEEAVRALVVRTLRSCGYTVLEAADGDEALRVSRAQAPGTIHLLLTDVVMPGMGGRDAAAGVRELHPAAKALFMSGYTEHATLRHTRLEPGSPFLHKPFAPSALAQAVRAALDAEAPQSDAEGCSPQS